MAEINKVVRQIATKDAAGNDVNLNIGSDETKVLADGGTRTVEAKFKDYAKKSESTKIHMGPTEPPDWKEGDFWFDTSGN